MVSDAWATALLHAGLGALGSAERGESTGLALANGARGALSGLQAVREAGQADREHMLRMAGIRNQLNAQAAQRMALQEAAAEKKRRSGLIDQISSAIPDPRKRAEFMLDPDGYLKARREAEAPMTAFEQAKIGIARQERQDKLADRAMPDAYETEVTRILRANPGLAKSREGLQQAQNIALGLVKSATDPVRGGTATYNLATGVGAPIETPKPDLDTFGADGSPITIDAMAGEVGAIPFAEDVIARTLGQAEPALVNEARTRAASQLDFLKQKAITAFATSARPPVIEQQRIEALFPSKGIFDSEARAAQQLDHLRDLAVATHDDYVGLIESGQLPFAQENELRGKVAELRQVVNMLPERQAFALPDVPAGDLGPDPLGLFE